MQTFTNQSAPWIAIAAVIGIMGLGAYHVGSSVGKIVGGRTAQRLAELEPYETQLAEQQRLLQVNRGSADLGTARIVRHMVAMQTRIVYLDALAVRLIASSGIDEHEFDFTTDPPLGGPEESSIDDADVAAALARTTAVLGTQIEDRWRKLDVLEDLLVWTRLSDDVRPEGLPVASAYISSRFGERIDPVTGKLSPHKGIDFAGRAGSDIVAVASGIVIWSGLRDGYGRTVEIDHGSDRVTRYAHNAENLVGLGDVVTRGQPIARLGRTGRTTGPNLHFEVLRSGEAVDPASYLKQSK